MKVLTPLAALLSLAFLSSCHKSAQTPQAAPQSENVSRQHHDAALAAPVITGFTPVSGASRALVSISGAGFSPVTDSNLVLFNGVKALNFTASDTLLVVFAPDGALTGRISVTVAGRTAVSATDFTFPPPNIFATLPTSSHVGDTITILGFGFSIIPAQNTVLFANNATATILSVTSARLRVRVPAGAVTGKITVKEGAALVMSPADFTVLP